MFFQIPHSFLLSCEESEAAAKWNDYPVTVSEFLLEANRQRIPRSTLLPPKPPLDDDFPYCGPHHVVSWAASRLQIRTTVDEVSIEAVRCVCGRACGGVVL